MSRSPTSKGTRAPDDTASLELTSGELAALLRVDLKTIHNWVNRGHLVGRRTSGRHLRFDRIQVVRFMRGYGYPVPERLSSVPLRVLVESPRGGAWSVVRHLRRGSTLTLCRGLFQAALGLARGGQEILVLDLDARPLDLVAELVQALRQEPLTASVWLIGLGRTRSTRERFFKLGGDAALPTGSEREVRALARWAIGAEPEPPRRAELRQK